jgi:hypothetical protein
MNIEEANKIVAEYMGWEKYEHDVFGVGYRQGKLSFGFDCNFPDYRSLDDLIPVWEKLKLMRVTLEPYNGWSNEFDPRADVDLSHNHESRGSTLQEAACIATAKAIQELKND